MSKTCEEIYISRIQSGIRGIRLRTKTPLELNLEKWLQKLKPLNNGMYLELSEKYQKQINNYEKNLKK